MTRPGRQPRLDFFQAALQAGVLNPDYIRNLALGLPVPAAPRVDPDAPRRVGEAPVVFSTCTELAPRWRFVWDVNSYYRDLGVHWAAGRRQLKDAYLARDGQRSQRLTYVLAQLLDATTRRQYDAMPPLSVFPDRYVIEEAERQLKVEIARRIMERGITEDEADASVIADGLKTSATHQQQVDEMLAGCDDQVAPPQDETPPAPPAFPWGHYLWRSPDVDDRVLAVWQRRVVRAAVERGIRARIAVGACGRVPHRVLVTKVGQVTVVWLNHQYEPSEEAAALAADAILRSTSTTRTIRPAGAGSNTPN